MSNNEKMAKPKYEAPVVIDLGEMSQGFGYCAAGTAAPLDYCTAGTAAGTACTDGSIALTAACTAGGAPGA